MRQTSATPGDENARRSAHLSLPPTSTADIPNWHPLPDLHGLHCAFHSAAVWDITSRSKLNPLAIFEVRVFPKALGSPHSGTLLKCPSGSSAGNHGECRYLGESYTCAVQARGAVFVSSLEGGLEVGKSRATGPCSWVSRQKMTRLRLQRWKCVKLRQSFSSSRSLAGSSLAFLKSTVIQFNR